MVLKIQDLTFGYRGTTVFKSFSADIHDSVHIVTGRNGCGKTTLLKILAGILKVDNTSINSFLNKEFSKLILLNQETFFQKELSLSEILLIYSSRLSRDHKSKRSSLLRALDMEASYRKPYRKLSTGQKKKAMFILGCLYDADHILMDEPFESVDSDSIKKMCSYLINNDQKNFILTTHSDISISIFKNKTDIS